ncbi:glyoxalase/bleomycin resistance/extradiol dioxygenase family protein [Lujinxingia litoralis]|uniref:Glyoxalase/bleomycin resistance/extradiol dioxygenase family protein n=1 Tax=Lujinxingia litoralis TaxID=2211119 RepID=A0A328C7F7_9DELT|nr:VOC family protein [Lujinxingia litoralis]RAL23012.1 glyoxalase/bleomycin resistance/extradiol dioxygenase family protein [Lujinxingia litoralis]
MSDLSGRPFFINLAVENVERSRRFFEALGYAFDARFEGEQACCLIINDLAYAMLLEPSFFQNFTERKVCDTSSHSEALLCVLVPTREEVDEMVEKAVAHGGAYAMPKQEQGGMYGWSFYDVDGHHWEVGWMGEGLPPQE